MNNCETFSIAGSATIERFDTIDAAVNNAEIKIPQLLVVPKDSRGQYELDDATFNKS